MPLHFGNTYYPKIIGFAMPFFTILSSLGSSLTGWIHDATHSYILAWKHAILVLTIGLVILILASPPLYPSIRGNGAITVAG